MASKYGAFIILVLESAILCLRCSQSDGIQKPWFSKQAIVLNDFFLQLFQFDYLVFHLQLQFQ